MFKSKRTPDYSDIFTWYVLKINHNNKNEVNISPFLLVMNNSAYFKRLLSLQIFGGVIVIEHKQ